MKKPLVFSITGQSASGKSFLEKALKDTGRFGKAISHTTRPMRSGEENGVDYYFVSKEDFAQMVDTEQMIEAVEFGGYLYGISKDEVKRLSDLGLPVVIVCEPNGRNQIARYCAAQRWSYVPVYAFASQETIMKRFVERFINDVQQAGDSAADARKLRQSYVSRLLQMSQVEVHWTKNEFGYARSFLLETIEDQQAAIGWFGMVASNYGYDKHPDTYKQEFDLPESLFQPPKAA